MERETDIMASTFADIPSKSANNTTDIPANMKYY